MCSSFLNKTLIFLEVASQTKVSDFDFWALVATAQKDVLVLDIPMNDLFFVDVF